MAVAEFNEMRRVLPADVVAEAEAELWCDGMSIDPHPEPEVMQEEARLEAQARFWGWSRLSPEQYNQYQRLAGQYIYADLADAMADPQYEEGVRTSPPALTYWH